MVLLFPINDTTIDTPIIEISLSPNDFPFRNDSSNVEKEKERKKKLTDRNTSQQQRDGGRGKGEKKREPLHRATVLS